MLKDVLKGKPNVDIVKLHKSGGVVPRNSKYRQRMRIYRTQEYFYGLTNELSPHANVVNFMEYDEQENGERRNSKLLGLCELFSKCQGQCCSWFLS
jgi:hypothetical protein